MITLGAIIDAIEDFAPLRHQESYDNSGLLLGDRTLVISSAVLCLDINEEVIEEAIELGSNLIISHHPLVFSGIKRFSNNDYVSRVLQRAIKKDIAIYCCHTNIDSVFNGVSFRIGERLGLTNMRILIPKIEDSNVGLGVIGDLSEDVDTVSFIADVANKLDCKMIRHSDIERKEVKVVAVCGGSGASFISNAISAGADIYLSSDFKYHDFFLEKSCMTIADIGHFEGEKYTLDIFYDIISKKIANFAIHCTKKGKNPINYFISK